MRPPLKVREEEAGEVSVHALIPADELVGEGQTRHQAALLQPEDGGEGTAEEDALYSGESDQALGEGGLLVSDPPQSPIGLLADAGDYSHDGLVHVPCRRRY